MMKGTNIKETVEAKAAYEIILHEKGHKVEAYHGDNIRTALLHAKRKWLKDITSTLWPFCYRVVKERQNRLDLNSNGMSPLEVLLGHREEITVEDYHSWGCPIFALDSKLQSGQGIGSLKWDPRAHIEVYLGHSPVHAGNVSLVIKVQTGHVSPQYHMVFDIEFTTVPYLNSDKAPPNC
eukprot:845498-Ditylum_brightwellii.AAC.2